MFRRRRNREREHSREVTDSRRHSRESTATTHQAASCSSHAESSAGDQTSRTNSIEKALQYVPSLSRFISPRARQAKTRDRDRPPLPTGPYTPTRKPRKETLSPPPSPSNSSVSSPKVLATHLVPAVLPPSMQSDTTPTRRKANNVLFRRKLGHKHSNETIWGTPVDSEAIAQGLVAPETPKRRPSPMLTKEHLPPTPTNSGRTPFRRIPKPSSTTSLKRMLKEKLPKLAEEREQTPNSTQASSTAWREDEQTFASHTKHLRRASSQSLAHHLAQTQRLSFLQRRGSVLSTTMVHGPDNSLSRPSRSSRTLSWAKSPRHSRALSTDTTRSSDLQPISALSTRSDLQELSQAPMPPPRPPRPSATLQRDARMQASLQVPFQSSKQSSRTPTRSPSPASPNEMLVDESTIGIALSPTLRSVRSATDLSALANSQERAVAYRVGARRDRTESSAGYSKMDYGVGQSATLNSNERGPIVKSRHSPLPSRTRHRPAQLPPPDRPLPPTPPSAKAFPPTLPQLDASCFEPLLPPTPVSVSGSQGSSSTTTAPILDMCSAGASRSLAASPVMSLLPQPAEQTQLRSGDRGSLPLLHCQTETRPSTDCRSWSVSTTWSLPSPLDGPARSSVAMAAEEDHEQVVWSEGCTDPTHDHDCLPAAAVPANKASSELGLPITTDTTAVRIQSSAADADLTPLQSPVALLAAAEPDVPRPPSHMPSMPTTPSPPRKRQQQTRNTTLRPVKNRPPTPATGLVKPSSVSSASNQSSPVKSSAGSSQVSSQLRSSPATSVSVSSSPEKPAYLGPLCSTPPNHLSDRRRGLSHQESPSPPQRRLNAQEAAAAAAAAAVHQAAAHDDVSQGIPATGLPVPPVSVPPLKLFKRRHAVAPPMPATPLVPAAAGASSFAPTSPPQPTSSTSSAPSPSSSSPPRRVRQTTTNTTFSSSPPSSSSNSKDEQAMLLMRPLTSYRLDPETEQIARAALARRPHTPANALQQFGFGSG